MEDAPEYQITQIWIQLQIYLLLFEYRYRYSSISANLYPQEVLLRLLYKETQFNYNRVTNVDLFVHRPPSRLAQNCRALEQNPGCRVLQAPNHCMTQPDYHPAFSLLYSSKVHCTGTRNAAQQQITMRSTLVIPVFLFLEISFAKRDAITDRHEIYPATVAHLILRLRFVITCLLYRISGFQTNQLLSHTPFHYGSKAAE